MQFKVGISTLIDVDLNCRLSEYSLQIIYGEAKFIPLKERHLLHFEDYKEPHVFL